MFTRAFLGVNVLEGDFNLLQAHGRGGKYRAYSTFRVSRGQKLATATCLAASQAARFFPARPATV